MFLFFCYFLSVHMVINIKLKTESQTIKRKPHCKVTKPKLKKNSNFSWVRLIRHITTRLRSHAFRLGEIYILDSLKRRLECM